jgi:hypothetical protein
MDRYRDFEPGTRVRLKPPARMMSGWRGTGTILYGTIALKDGCTSHHPDGTAEACDWQWAIMRDQTPNPEHAEALRKIAAEGLDSDW